MLGTIYYSASSPQRIKAFSRGRCDPGDLESTLRHLVPFLAAAFRSAPVTRPRAPAGTARPRGAGDPAQLESIAARRPLRTLLGDYPATHALRHGRLTSRLVPLAFADVTVPNKAFKRVVRDLEFDVAEFALMTFLMARSRGVPLRLLPVVVFSRNPLPHLVCDRDRRRLAPARSRAAAASVFALTRPPRPSGCVRCSPISSASSSRRRSG